MLTTEVTNGVRAESTELPKHDTNAEPQSRRELRERERERERVRERERERERVREREGAEKNDGRDGTSHEDRATVS